jgi:hypothetical protein
LKKLLLTILALVVGPVSVLALFILGYNWTIVGASCTAIIVSGTAVWRVWKGKDNQSQLCAVYDEMGKEGIEGPQHIISLEIAADQGHAEAQDRLNEMYAPGKDVPPDYPDQKTIEGGGSGLQSKSPDIHDSKAVDDDLKICLKELKALHEEGMIDDDEYKSLKVRALGL